jgi:hypothetical protein
VTDWGTSDREVNGVAYTYYPVGLFSLTWSCGKCASLVTDVDVHAGFHKGEDEITERVRELMDAREEKMT